MHTAESDSKRGDARILENVRDVKFDNSTVTAMGNVSYNLFNVVIPDDGWWLSQSDMRPGF